MYRRDVTTVTTRVGRVYRYTGHVQCSIVELRLSTTAEFSRYIASVPTCHVAHSLVSVLVESPYVSFRGVLLRLFKVDSAGIGDQCQHRLVL